MRHLVRISLPVLYLTCAGPAMAAPLFTDFDKNVAVMEEAALTNYDILGRIYGASGSNSLALSGTFSASSWSLSLTGTFSGMPASLSLTGSFDTLSNTGSFNSAGTVGSSTLLGSGTWSWTDVSAVKEDLGFGTGLTPASIAPGPPPEFDEELLGDKVYSAEGPFLEDTIVSDDGRIQATFNGNPVPGVVYHQGSLEYVPASDEDEFIHNSGSATGWIFTSFLSASDVFPEDTLTGTVSTVPEPSSVWLVGSATVCLLARTWRSRLRGSRA